MLFLSEKESFTPDDKIAILPATKLRNIIKTAELFEVPLAQAIGSRRSYLWKEYDYHLNCETDYTTWQVIHLPAMIDIINQFFTIKKDLYYRSKPKNSDDAITEDMVSRAKAYPLTDLYEFVKGKAPCPVHKEKTASLHYNSQRNKVHCFGCGKNMDSIDMYMLLNDATFYQAVKRLCSLR
jgi:hypothetical protein